MKEKMNTVEDRIFKGFCDSIGVSNIRQYEERELKSQQDREKKKMEHENQINRISNQLEYERKREEQLLTNQRKFERTVQDDEVCCYFFIFLQNFFFSNSMEKWVRYSTIGYFSIPFEKITFYTEILTLTVEL